MCFLLADSTVIKVSSNGALLSEDGGIVLVVDVERKKQEGGKG